MEENVYDEYMYLDTFMQGFVRVIPAVVLAVTEAGEESIASLCPADVDTREDAVLTVMTEPVSWQTLALARLGGVEAGVMAGIEVGGPSEAHLLGLNKTETKISLIYVKILKVNFILTFNQNYFLLIVMFIIEKNIYSELYTHCMTHGFLEKTSNRKIN